MAKDPSEYKVKVSPSLKNLTARGRPVGCKNKNGDLFRSIIDTYYRMGGDKALYEWSKESPRNKTLFYTVILPKILPKNVDIAMSGTIDVAQMVLAGSKLKTQLLASNIIEGKVLEVSHQGLVTEVIEEALEEDESGIEE
jgi:hypothetical protein